MQLLHCLQERSNVRRAKKKCGDILLASADEMHDLQTVTVVELGGGPFRARDNLAIEFYRDTIAFHAELLDKFGQ